MWRLAARRERADRLLVVLTLFCAGILWYRHVGIPESLARASLFSTVLPKRTILALGLADVLLLLRFLSLKERVMGRGAAAALAALGASLLALGAHAMHGAVPELIARCVGRVGRSERGRRLPGPSAMEAGRGRRRDGGGLGRLHAVVQPAGRGGNGLPDGQPSLDGDPRNRRATRRRERMGDLRIAEDRQSLPHPRCPRPRRHPRLAPLRSVENPGSVRRDAPGLQSLRPGAVPPSHGRRARLVRLAALGALRRRWIPMEPELEAIGVTHVLVWSEGSPRDRRFWSRFEPVGQAADYHIFELPFRVK